MKQVFESIYKRNLWRHGSGQGSLVMHTRGYIKFLDRFIRDRQIQTVVDIGCGDWQFSQFINWDKVSYEGYDIVDSVVTANRARYSRPNVTFHSLDVTSHRLPRADLLIAKDVFQHWSNQSILKFIPKLKHFGASLITNSVPLTGSPENKDIADGDFRYLDLRLAPFGVPATPIYEFTDFRPWLLRPIMPPHWRKTVLLVEK